MDDKKEKRLLEAMQLVDEAYIEEASPVKPEKSKKEKPARKSGRSIWIRYGVIAACICCVILGAVWLFVPLKTKKTDVSKYSEGEYYEIIEKLAEYYAVEPRYDNRWEQFTEGVGNLFFGDLQEGTMDASPGDGGNMSGMPGDGAGESYQEITDNQVDGIIEGDLMKRSDKYIYYLYDKTLMVYSIAGEKSELIAEYEIDTKGMGKAYVGTWEIFLSQDCDTITVIAPYYDGKTSAQVAVISLNVENPRSITEEERVVVSGSYLSSRLVDGEILLMTGYRIFDVDYDKEETFLPQIDYGDGAQSIAAEDIICPEELSDVYYTVVMKVEEKTLKACGSKAFLSYSEDVYVSEDAVYAMRNFTMYQDKEQRYSGCAMTEIASITYDGATLENGGMILLEGRIKDRYSMDEYNGILRVVTTTERWNGKKYDCLGKKWVDCASTGTNASLFCVDTETWEVVAAVEDFAPEGETVESVRFDGESGYVCTAEVISFTDPVFFFNLSDLNNITYKDTGTIEGYSTSLVDMGDGYLLGIGVGDSSDTVKMEVYIESETGVDPLCSYEVENASYSTNYKSYYIDRENRLIGLGVQRYNEEKGCYVMLLFDGYELQELLCMPLAGQPENQRAVCIDGYAYMFGHREFVVQQVFGE